jgi:GTP-binding protein Era
LTQKLTELCAFEEIFYISATTADGLPDLKVAIAAAMPEGAWHFPEDQVSDATERLVAAEITREQLYLQLHDELPYASTVETEKYVERPDGSVEIYQQILVERDSQRAIVLGKGGSRIKLIGATARKELAELMGRTGPSLPARKGQGRLGRRPVGVSRYGARLGRIAPISWQLSSSEQPF